MKKFTCKFCGASVELVELTELTEGRDFSFCPYCGKKQSEEIINVQKNKTGALNVLFEHVLFPLILSGFLTFIVFLIVLIFSGQANWNYFMCLTIFGAVGYEIGNILTLKFPCKNSDMWPMTGMGEGWILALMWLLRMSTH